MSNEPVVREREPIERVRARLEALVMANAAPRCGARSKRTGKPCRAAAMANGRCKVHGGKSTGPRTPEGDGSSLLTDGRVPRDTAAQLELEEREGALMWPERFGAREVARIKAELGPYMASGRLEQMPVPDKGGIFQRDWWQPWDSPDGKFPVFSYIVASLDGAFTEKEENDPSALTVWGVFQNEEGKSRIMLVHAWRKHLPFSGVRNDKPPNETVAAFKHRTRAQWGLLEWVNDTCERFKVNLLLIENKGPGISAAQELQNRFGQKPWGVHLVKIKGDKVARALAAQATFSQELVYAPDRDWSQMAIDEMANFPKGRYDDLTDSTTQAILFLRSTGLLAPMQKSPPRRRK